MKKARLFRRSRSPNYYADFVTADGLRRQRSTRKRTPAEAWQVVAGWEDVPDEVAPSVPVVAAGATMATGNPVHTEMMDVTPAAAPDVDPLVAYHLVHGAPPTPEEQRFHDSHGRWPLSPAELDQWLEQSTSWWQWLARRDWMLTAVLAVFSVGSAYTTVVGASQILPVSMAWPMGLAVQLLLFLLLEGLVATTAPLRRWGGVVVLAGISVYTSYFCYYEQLAGEAHDREQVDRALQLHAELVSTIFAPARSRALGMRSEGESLLAQAEQEAARGGTTGVHGYGPRARALAEEGNRRVVDAARLQTNVDRLQSAFDGSTDGMTAGQIYRRDLEAWQLAPPEWKEGTSPPSREAYLDATADVALLTPLHHVAAGEPAAWMALILAVLVDGTTIVLGTASARRHAVEGLLVRASRRVAILIVCARYARRMLDEAHRNGIVMPMLVSPPNNGRAGRSSRLPVRAKSPWRGPPEPSAGR